jgi:hypothetical protein
VKTDKPKAEPLTEANYRETARRAIDKYYEKGMIIDSLLWSTIIGFYEAELEKR